MAWAQLGLSAVSQGGLGEPLAGAARKDSVPGWLPCAPALSFLMVFGAFNENAVKPSSLD